jgi:predicted metal-binding transcription factor (methanogenesis marker protein 9)
MNRNINEKNIIDELFEKKNKLHNYLVNRSHDYIVDNIKIVKTTNIEKEERGILLKGGNRMDFKTAMESSFKRMNSRLNK